MNLFTFCISKPPHFLNPKAILSNDHALHTVDDCSQAGLLLGFLLPGAQSIWISSEEPSVDCSGLQVNGGGG